MFLLGSVLLGCSPQAPQSPVEDIPQTVKTRQEQRAERHAKTAGQSETDEEGEVFSTKLPEPDCSWLEDCPDLSLDASHCVENSAAVHLTVTEGKIAFMEAGKEELANGQFVVFGPNDGTSCDALNVYYAPLSVTGEAQ